MRVVLLCGSGVECDCADAVSMLASWSALKHWKSWDECLLFQLTEGCCSCNGRPVFYSWQQYSLTDCIRKCN